MRAYILLVQVESKLATKKLPSLVIASTPVFKVLEEKEIERIEKERRIKLLDQKKNEKPQKGEHLMKLKDNK